MRRTRHFAGVIGAAGIVVSPFMMATAAQADDTLPPDTTDSVVGNANPGGVDANEGGDVPNLPVTRVVGKAAAVDLMLVDGNPVALGIPDEVAKSLPDSGTVLTREEAEALEGVLQPYVLDGELALEANSDIGFNGHDSVDRAAWAVEDDATEPSSDVDETVQEDTTIEEQGTHVEEQVAVAVETPVSVPPATSNAGAVEARGIVSAPNVAAASNTVGVAAPAPVDEVADVVEDTADDAIVDPTETPQLPVTGEDQTARTALPAAEDGGLPLAPLLGITGLVLGGGIGVVTLRKKLELADSK